MFCASSRINEASGCIVLVCMRGERKGDRERVSLAVCVCACVHNCLFVCTCVCPPDPDRPVLSSLLAPHPVLLSPTKLTAMSAS